MKRSLPQFIALMLLHATGCALFGVHGNPFRETRETLKPDQITSFKSETPTRNVVRLETAIMSAPATDKRIRELVWATIDEIGPLSLEDRRRLNQSGLRVGVCEGTLPSALESLRRSNRVDRTSLLTNGASGTQNGGARSQSSHVAIPEDSSSVIDLSSNRTGLIIPPGKVKGMNNGRELPDARCMLEITPIEYGPGWVVIRILPQIHHGSVTTRYNIAGNGQRMPLRQEIQPLYEQQFQLKLHTDETVVIGHLQQEDWTVGRLLFQSDSLTIKSERLVALQLVEIEEVAGEKSLHVSYSKY